MRPKGAGSHGKRNRFLRRGKFFLFEAVNVDGAGGELRPSDFPHDMERNADEQTLKEGTPFRPKNEVSPYIPSDS